MAVIAVNQIRFWMMVVTIMLYARNDSDMRKGKRLRLLGFGRRL